MRANQIWLGTMKFNFIKLGIGLAFDLVAIILLIAFVGVGSLAGGGGAYIGLLIWIGTVFGGYRFMSMYVGYMIKSAHIACIAVAAQDGRLPENMLETGKDMVKERFVTANVYIAVDKLVAGAVRQLQKVIGNIGGFLGFVPGMDNIVNIVQKFIGIFLGYVDECCLGYTFVNKEQNAWKSACDGVCIYFQNAKLFLKEAVKITLIVVVSTALVFFIAAGMAAGLTGGFHMPGVASLLIAVLFAVTVKKAFIDSYILCKLLTVYVQTAPQTEISVDLYGKLCGLSNKFREMYNNAINPGNTVQPEVNIM